MYKINKAKEIKLIPGPGQYDTKPSINTDGSYFISRFKSSLARRFGKEQREIERSSALRTPGPGSYRAPSEFGHYRAQSKFVVDSERTEIRIRSKCSLGKKNARSQSTDIRY